MSNFEWYGNIPKNWNVKKGKYLYKFIQTGKKDSGENNPGGKYPFFTCSKEVLTIDEYSFDREALLVAGNGIVGETKYYNGKFDAYQRVYVISDFTSEIFVPYLTLYMTNNFIIYLTWRMIGSVINFVKLDDIKNFDISYPVYQTQMKIANFLENKSRKIEDLIMNQQQQIEKLKEYKLSLISEVVTKGLDPNVEFKDSGVEWIGKIPINWEIIRLKDLATNTTEKNENENLQYIGLENIISKSFDFIETDNFYNPKDGIIAPKNSVLFGKLRPYLAKSFYCENDLSCSSEFAVFLFDNEITSKYFLFITQSYGFIDVINMSTYGTKMPRANINFINNLNIPLPSLEHQKLIVENLMAKVHKINSLIQYKTRKVEKLTEYKKSLIYEYVTGKKEVS